MKVLVVFSFGYSLETWQKAGNLKRELDYYKYFSKTYKTKFYFITYGNKSDYELIKKYSDYIEVFPAYDYISMSNFKFINFIKSFYLPFKLKNLLKSYDLIKANQLTAFWTALIFKIILKKPLITKTGFDAFIFAKNEKKPVYKILIFYFLTQIALIFSNFYSVSSKSDIKFIKSKYFFTKNLLYRPNWVYVNYSSLEKDRKKNKILMVGRLVDQKNYEYALNLVKNSKYEIDIVGSGNLKNSIEELSKKLNIKVNFLGNYDYDELIKLYSQYKYFLLTSKFEGNPKVLLEALSSKCIVIVSNIENNLEIIRDGQNGIVLDIDKAPIKISSLLDDNILNYNFESIKLNSIKTIENDYSFEKALIQEYEDFVNLINS